jgi:protein phosphatase
VTVVYVRGQWYLADNNGRVAIFHGERGKVAGISLSRLSATTAVPTDQVTQSDQELLRSGQVSGHDKVNDEFTTVRDDACQAWVTAHPAPPPRKHKKTTQRQPPPTPPSWCPQQP